MLAAIAPAALRRVNELRRVAPLPEWGISGTERLDRAPLLVLWDSLVPQSWTRAGPSWSRFLSSGSGRDDGSGKNSKEAAEGAILEEGALKEETLENGALRESGKTEASGCVENSRRLFIYIEEILRPQEELKRYEPLKACLRLLSRHAGLFSLQLIEEGVRNMHWLQEHCASSVRPVYDTSFNSLVSDNQIKNAQTLYKAFMKEALDVLDFQDSEHKQVSLAIRAVGKLATAIVKFSGKASLTEAFHRLEPFGTSTRVGEGREGSLGYAVTLVGAFADMVIHLDYIEDFMVIFIAQRAMEPVEEAPEEGSTQLWSHYVELWSHLLEFSSDRGFQLTAGSGEAKSFEELVASDVGNVGINETTFRESVFDAIMHCIIKALTELNLKYRVRIPTRTATNSEEVDAGQMNLKLRWTLLNL